MGFDWMDWIRSLCANGNVHCTVRLTPPPPSICANAQKVDSEDQSLLTFHNICGWIAKNWKCMVRRSPPPPPPAFVKIEQNVDSEGQPFAVYPSTKWVNCTEC